MQFVHKGDPDSRQVNHANAAAFQESSHGVPCEGVQKQASEGTVTGGTKVGRGQANVIRGGLPATCYKYMYLVSHDRRALRVGQTSAFRGYLIGYNKQARPPANKTLDRLLLSTKICMKRKIAASLGKAADELSAMGLKSLCLQSNLWFGKDKCNYFGINGTWIEKRTGKDKHGKETITFVMMTTFIALHALPSYTYTGEAIAEEMLKVLAEYSRKASDVILGTIDGASNGIKAVRIVKMSAFIGAAHNLAQGMVYATGEAGSDLLNPDMKRLFERAFVLAAKQRSSAKTTMMYSKAQGNMCAAAPKTKLTGLCHTRWTGRLMLAKTINVNEGPKRLVYTSFGPGDDEHEDDGFDSSYDVASDDNSEMALAMRYKANASIISSQEQDKDYRHFEGAMAPAVMVTKQFEVGPNKATAQQDVLLLYYLTFVYDPKTRHLFCCPTCMRTKKYQGNSNRSWENIPYKELTKPNLLLVGVLSKQLKNRFAAIPDIFLMAAALNPFADFAKPFRGNANLIARAKAIYKISLRTVLKSIVRTEFEALAKATAKAKATEKISKLVAKKAVLDMPECYFDMIYGRHSGAIDEDEIAEDEDNSLETSLEARIRDEVEKRLLIKNRNFQVSLTCVCTYRR